MKSGKFSSSGKEDSDLILSREEKLAIAREFTLLSNTFLSVALQDISACQYVLRILLEIPDLIVTSVKTQYVISKITSHDAILDVLATDSSKKLYQIEIQNKDNIDHARRSRFYGAMVDSEFLKKGAAYADLPEQYILYITATDIWRRGRTVYEIKKYFEGTNIPFEDGIHIRFVNAAINDGSTISQLMKYFKSAKPDDMSQGVLSERVNFLKTDERSSDIMCEVTERFIKIGEEYGRKIGEVEGRRIGQAEGKKIGRAEGMERVNSLFRILIQQNRLNDLKRAAADREFQEKLFGELGI